MSKTEKNVAAWPARHTSSTYVNFTRVNKIEAMYGRSHVNVNVETPSTFTFTRDLSHVASVSFTRVNFTCVCGTVKINPQEVNTTRKLPRLTVTYF